MKLNIADPTTGGQKVFDIEEDKKLRIFYEQRIAAEVDATPLGDAFKGYVLRITGGNDLQGFPMRQGVLTNGRVRLLLKGKSIGFRRPLHDGERRRKSVRGCIVGPDLAVLNLIVVKKGEAEIPGVTDKLIPNRVGPKRASRIRKLFNLTKDDDVRQFIKKKERVDKKDPSKKHTKMPHIQRLVTSRRLQHKRRLHSLHMKKLAKAKADRAAYNKLILERAEKEKTRKAGLAIKKKSAKRLHRLQAIKKAIEKRRNLKLRSKLIRKRLAEARLKKREALKAAGKLHQKTPREIRNIHNLIRRKRLTRYFKARAQLRKLRRDAFNKATQLKHLRTAYSKKDLSSKKKTHLRTLIAKLAGPAHKARKVMSKEGALKVLGKNKRPFNKIRAQRRHHKWAVEKLQERRAKRLAHVTKEKAAGRFPPPKKQKV